MKLNITVSHILFIMTTTITLSAMLTWLVTWLLIGNKLMRKFYHNQDINSNKISGLFWVLALVIHAMSLLHLIFSSELISLHFTSTASLVMWLSAGLLFVAQLKRPLTALGIIVIPLTIIGLSMQLIPVMQGELIPLSNGKSIHIISSLLAFSILTLAALQALLLALQSRLLHHHKSIRLIRTLPPLLDMEAMLFQLITLGMVLLSIGLLTGFFFMNSLFGQHIAHKTLLSIAAWGMFVTLLIGHWRYGWRGKIAVRWTLIASFILTLGFLGSKFVAEYLVRN